LAKAAITDENLTDTEVKLGGVESNSTITRTQRQLGRPYSLLGEIRGKKRVDVITGVPGKCIESERESDGVVVAKKRVMIVERRAPTVESDDKALK
jgi:hypothetical protein